MIVLILVTLVVFGLIFGSFANALVWRLHSQDGLQEEIDELKVSPKKHKAQLRNLETELRKLSMSRGRSMCSRCHHPLAPRDLAPLFSWVWLKGKCRYCAQPIEDTPWLEFGLPVAFVASYAFWPMALSGYGLLSFLFWLVFLVAFAALTVYDLRWYLLPDRIVWPLVALAVLQVLIYAAVFDGGVPAIVSAMWGVAMASGIFYVLYRVSDGNWIGGGDVKLGIVLGLLVGGPLQGVLLIFIASLLGTFASLPMLLNRKLRRTSIIPFGPFLMLAAWILVVFGDRLASWLDAYVLMA